MSAFVCQLHVADKIYFRIELHNNVYLGDVHTEFSEIRNQHGKHSHHKPN